MGAAHPILPWLRTPPSTEKVSSPLNTYETLFALGSVPGAQLNGHAFNFCFMVELEGVVSEGDVAPAVAEVIRRHPPLRMSFEWQGSWLLGGLARVYDPASPCEGHISAGEWTGHEALQATLEAELARGFEMHVPTRMRLRILTGVDSSCLLFTFCHAQFDGRSGAIVAQEVVRLLNGLALGPAPEYAAPWTLEGVCGEHGLSAAQCAVDSFSRAQPAWYSPRFFNGYMRRFYRIAPSVSGTPVEQRSHGCLCISLDAQQSACTVARAKAAGVTLTAWLTAAFEVALTKLPQMKPGVAMRLCQAYDARRDFPRDFASKLGMFVALVYSSTVPPASVSFQELCHRESETLKRGKEGKWSIAMSTVYRPLPCRQLLHLLMRFLSDFGANGHVSNFMLSNLGRVDYEDSARCKVRSTLLAGCCGPWASMVLYAVSTNGLLSLTFVYLRPAISREDVEFVRDDLLSRLSPEPPAAESERGARALRSVRARPTPDDM